MTDTQPSEDEILIFKLGFTLKTLRLFVEAYSGKLLNGEGGTKMLHAALKDYDNWQRNQTNDKWMMTDIIEKKFKPEKDKLLALLD